jgi:hypothetical protein
MGLDDLTTYGIGKEISKYALPGLVEALKRTQKSIAATTGEYFSYGSDVFKNALKSKTADEAIKKLATVPQFRTLLPGQLGPAMKKMFASTTPEQREEITKRIVKGKEWSEVTEPIGKLPLPKADYTVPKRKFNVATSLTQMPEWLQKSTLNPSLSPIISAGRAVAKQSGLTQPGKKVNIDPAKALQSGVTLGADLATHPINIATAGLGSIMKAIPAISRRKILNELYGAAKGSAGKVGKVIGSLPGINKIVKSAGKTPEDIEAYFQYGFGQSKRFNKEMDKLKTNRARFSTLTEKAVNKWNKLPSDRRLEVGKAFESGNYGNLSAKEKIIASDMRKIVNTAGRKSVAAGLLNPKTFEKNKDTYSRRLYEYFENPEFVEANPQLRLKEIMNIPTTAGKGMKIGKKLFEERGKSFKAKLNEITSKKTIEKLKKIGINTPENLIEADVNNIAKGLATPQQRKLGALDSVFKKAEKLKATATEQIAKNKKAYADWRISRGEMGPEFAGYKVGVGSTRTYEAAGKSLMFQNLAKDPKVVREVIEDVAEQPLKHVTYGNFKDLQIAKADGKEWLKMPNNKEFGAIADKWVNRWDGKEILDIHKNKSLVGKLWDSAISKVKSGKVVFSPAAQIRNMPSNVILMAYSGVPVKDSMKYVMESAESVAKKDKWYKMFIKNGGGGTTFSGTEIFKPGSPFQMMSPGLSKLKRAIDPAKKILALPGKVYQGVEETFKIATMRYWMEKKGYSAAKAVKKAEEALFDYSKLSPFVKTLRRYAIPFISFTSKALPATGKAILERPGSVLPILAFKDVWNNMMKEKLGISDRDYNLFKKKYGNWSLIVGGNNKKFNRLSLDYIVPGLTDLSGEGSRGILGESSWIPQSLQPSQFGFTQGAELAFNKNLYFDSPIIQPGASGYFDKEARNRVKALMEKGASRIEAEKAVLAGSKFGQGLGYLSRSLGPANPAWPRSYQFDKIRSAMTGRAINWSGDTMTPETALLSSIGIKTTPTDTMRIRKWDKKKFDKAINQLKYEKRTLRRLRKNNRLTEKEYKYRLLNVNMKIKDMRKRRRKDAKRYE